MKDRLSGSCIRVGSETGNPIVKELHQSHRCFASWNDYGLDSYVVVKKTVGRGAKAAPDRFNLAFKVNKPR